MLAWHYVDLHEALVTTHDSTEAKHLCMRDYVNALFLYNCREVIVSSCPMFCNKVLRDSSGRRESWPLYNTTQASSTAHTWTHTGTEIHTATHMVRTGQRVPVLHTSERQDPSLSLCSDTHLLTPSLLLSCTQAKYNESPTTHAYTHRQTAEYKYSKTSINTVRDAQEQICVHLDTQIQDAWVTVGERQPAEIKANSLCPSHCRDEVIF